jgi:Fe2+ transport system protein B
MALKSLLKNVVGAVAPTLGTALGGPMGGMAANLIAETLGVPNNTKSIERAIAEATPEQMLQLKKAEQEFEQQMKQLDVDIFKLETDDKRDARKSFSKDWTTRIMGIMTLTGFMTYIFLVTLQPPEQNSEALINLVLGYLGGLASAVISFYFGASQSKEDGR